MTRHYFDPQRKALILVAADGTETVITDRTQWAAHLGKPQSRTAARRMEAKARGNHGGWGVSRSNRT